MEINQSIRLSQLPAYLFKELNGLKAEAKRRGVELTDLGVGDPDMPTPEHIVSAMKSALDDPSNHKYPAYSGDLEFNSVAAKWFKKRFGVELDPATEIVALIGSKEGLVHLPLACLNPGQVGLTPSPAYPAYNIGIRLAGGETWLMELKKENDFLPDLEAIPPEVADRAGIMFLNYPNNPTSAVAEGDFFAEVVRFAERHGIIVCHDAAYSELAYDGYRPVSFLETPGAKGVGIEVHSLSKTYNMTGWRLGFAAGNAEVIKMLRRLKGNLDSGVFKAVQLAGKAALEGPTSFLENLNREYQKRRDLMVQGLSRLGYSLARPKATFYLWVETPSGLSSAEFCRRLLVEQGVVVTPGSGFGAAGEGYFRIALTSGTSRLKEALDRIGAAEF